VRRAGAAAVSVMVVGRWLSRSHGRTAEFVKTRLQPGYDAAATPVSCNTRNESALLVGSMIRASTN
jgi:hypothetical protein